MADSQSIKREMHQLGVLQRVPVVPTFDFLAVNRKLIARFGSDFFAANVRDGMVVCDSIEPDAKRRD